MFICYILASIGKTVFGKIVLPDRHAVEKGEYGGLPLAENIA